MPPEIVLELMEPAHMRALLEGVEACERVSGLPAEEGSGLKAGTK